MGKVKKIQVACPVMNGNEKKYVNECIDSTWISSRGEFIDRFEKEFAEFCGVKYALCCSNGTVSLHLALMAAGVKVGDEVIIPTFTYIATANVVKYCGATPVFIDCDEKTWNINTKLIEKKITSKTKVIMPTHLYGYPSDMKEINKIAKKHGLFVIEDAAEAHGAEVKGKKVGSIGDIGSFSFFGNKIITTGEGGMVTTDDEKLYSKMKLLRSQGVDANKMYWHSVVGYNYRMTNVQAAIGLAQLEKIEWHLEQRNRIKELYTKHLKDLKEYIEIQEVDNDRKHVYWMYSIVLKENIGVDRDELMGKLAKDNIETRPLFYPMHMMPPYYEEGVEYPMSESIAKRGLNLPTHSQLEEKDIEYIAGKLKLYIK